MSTTKHKLPTTKQGEPVMLTVDADGRLMLPTDMVKDNGLEPGEHVEVERVLFGLLLIPTRTDEEMEAFQGPNWREDLDRAKGDIAAGRTTFHASTEEFLAALEARTNADPRRD